MATFVLIHGSYLGGWAWRWVTPHLRAAGHNVYVPSLTGVGERVHLASAQVDLDTHITDVVNLLYYEDLAGVVLVGWSYGGSVVTGVADRVPERIAQIVYLDSDVPRDGETSFPPGFHAAKKEQASAMGDGWRLPPTWSADDMAPELSAETRHWIFERVTPDLLNTRIQPIRLTGAGAAIPTPYVRCAADYDPADEIKRREDARVQSEPSWRYRELAADHGAPFTAPQAVADLLLEIATSTGTDGDPPGRQ
jgi:pimeloyl-ACP methyl ester carboxylesterase